MEFFKSAVGGVLGGIMDVVGLSAASSGSEHNSPENRGHKHENMDSSHEKYNEWWLVSQQSATNSQYPNKKCLLLQLKLGSVAEEEADVLVSSVGRDLDLSHGMITKSMLMKSGDAMQQELRERYPGGICEFDFAVSRAHRLSCQSVLHVACGRFRDEESHTRFTSVICRCLQYASGNLMKSIAFPPIGTGNLEYAPQMVAKLFYEATTTFLATCPNNSLECVTLAVFDHNTYQIFKSTLDQLMPDARVSPKLNHEARESIYAYHQEEAEGLLVSQQSGSDSFGTSLSEQYSQSKDTSQQEHSEWWLVSQHSSDRKYPPTQCLLLQLKIGSIAEEQADVLVSSVGHDLNLSQGVISKSVFSKAGDTMQRELRERYPIGIQEFEFAISNAHQLSCKAVLHVACGQCKDEQSKTEFASVLCRCLQNANDNRMKSIAFPPIGTGNLGYTPHMVAKLFYKAITMFLKRNYDQSLEVVTLAVADGRTYQVFNSTLDRLIQESTTSMENNEATQSPAESADSGRHVAESTMSMENNEATQSPAESAGSGWHVAGEHFFSEDNKEVRFCVVPPQNSKDTWPISEDRPVERSNVFLPVQQSITGNDEIEGNASSEIMIAPPSDNLGNISTNDNTKSQLSSLNRYEKQALNHGLSDGNVLEFAAPLKTNDEHVALHFSDITKKHVNCVKESCILRVSFATEEAFQQIVSTSEAIIGEHKLTRLIIDLDSFPPTTARHGGIGGSCPEFVLLSLHVESRVHITENCLEELVDSMKSRQYSLHRTAVPGELMLEWRCPESQRDVQQVMRQIYEYADNFETIVVEITEQTAEGNLRDFLNNPPSADLSCTKIGQRRKDQLYVITCKKDGMPHCRRFLKTHVKPVHHSLVVPFNSVVGLESEAISNAEAATAKMHESVEMKEGVTRLTAKDVVSRGMSASVMTNDAGCNGNPSTRFLSVAVGDQTNDKSKLVGNRSRSNHAAHRTNCSGQSQARHRFTGSQSEPHSTDAATNCFTCSTSTFGDTLTRVQQEGSTFSSTDQLPPPAVSDSQLLQEANDQQKTRQSLQQQSLPSHETALQQKHELPRMLGQSSQLNSELSVEGYTFLHAQTEEQWLAEQERNGTPRGFVRLWSENSTSTSSALGNEQSSQQSEEAWLAEQERNGTPRGRVCLWSNNSAIMPTTRGQLEHEQDVSETALSMENQKLLSTKPEAVILKHTSNAPACDQSMIHLQQHRKLEMESQTPPVAWNPTESQEQARLPEDVGHRPLQAVTSTHGCTIGNTEASRIVSSHMEKSVNLRKQSDV